MNLTMRSTFALLVTTLLACNQLPRPLRFPTVVAPRVQPSLATLEHRRVERVFTFDTPVFEYPEGSISVVATYVDALARENAVTVVNVTRDESLSRLTTTLAFDSGPSGIAALRIGVEPTIDRVTVPVVVARDGETLPSFIDTTSCPYRLQRLRSGLTACVEQQQTVVRRGNEVIAAMTGHANVAADTLWLSNQTTRKVERYEGHDGGLRLTHVSSGVPFDETPGFTQPNASFRHGYLFTLADAGTLDISDKLLSDPTARFVGLIENMVVFRRSSGEVCTPPTRCSARLGTSLVGAFDTGWWELDDATNTLTATTVRGPATDAGPTVVSLLSVPVTDQILQLSGNDGRARPVVEHDGLTLVYDWALDGGLAVYGFQAADAGLRFHGYQSQTGEFVAFLLPDGGSRFVEFPR